MAGSAAVLNVKVLVDAAAAASGLDKVGDKASELGDKLTGSLAKLAGGAAIAAFGAKAISAASDLEDAMGSVDSVFKDSANQVHAWASDTTDSIRLPQAEFEAYAASMGSMLKNAGVPMDELAGKTHELIQLAADLSAQSGQSASVGVEAMKAALKGEYEQLENLNVSITAAQVSTEALSLAHGDASKAADPLIRQQAALNLIYAQSGDALGAAERETGNFASQQDHLNEVMTNFLAAIGGPLLSALSSLLSLGSDMLTWVQPLAVDFADLLRWVTELPGPILGLAGAIAAVTFASAAGWIVSLNGMLQTLALRALYAGDAMKALAAGNVASALSGIGAAAGNAASSLYKMVGGATGLALIGVGVAVFSIVSYLNQVSAGFDKGTSALEDYTQALIDSNGASTDATAAAYQLAVTSSDAFAALVKDGFSGAEAFTILSGTIQDFHGQFEGIRTDKIANMSGETRTLTEGFIDANGQAGVLAQATLDANAAAGAATEGQEGLAGATEETTTAMENQFTAADVLKQALQEWQDLGEQTTLKRSLDEVKTAADAASTAMEFINNEIAVYSGAHVGLDKAQVNSIKNQKDLSAAITEYKEKVDSTGAAISTYNVAQLAQTDEGQKVFDQLTGQADAYGQVLTATFEHTNATEGMGKAIEATVAASKSQRDSFIESNKAAFGSAEAAAAVATQLGIIDLTTLEPKIVQVLMEDENVRNQITALAALGIDPKDVTFSADMDPLTKEFDGTLTYIDTVTGQPKTITVGAVTEGAVGAVNAIPGVTTPATSSVTADADTTPAEGKINSLVDGKRDTSIEVGATTTIYQAAVAALIADTPNRGPALVKVSADLALADGKVKAWMATSRQASDVKVDANLQAADAAVRQFMVASRQASDIRVGADLSQANSAAYSFMVARRQASDIVVSANTGPAQSAINAVQNGYYTATIRLIADTSAFYSAFNSLPSSKPVGAVPNLAPQARGFAAPTLAQAAPRSTNSASATGSITVNVSGALWPDQAARAVEDVLRRRDRRRGAVVL